VTRIIAGFAGSLVLAVPASGTRPTSDRVREAIFSALDARDALEGARVIDLYAGSGALGLEAASRGATSVTLVENGPRALRACRANATTLLGRASGGVTVEVVGRAVQTFLTATVATWDLAFLDPPYDLAEPELARDLALLAPRLSPGAIVVVERSSRAPRPELPPVMAVDRRKDYGDTTLWWVSAASTQPDAPSQPV
jgi:16S rRNA (guanine966-N2)-methyltransferase